MDVLDLINQLDSMLANSRSQSLQSIKSPELQIEWDRARLIELTVLRNEVLTLRSSLLELVEG